jgi:hypothetical protein
MSRLKQSGWNSFLQPSASLGNLMRINLINLERNLERLAEFKTVNGHLSDVERVCGGR